MSQSVIEEDLPWRIGEMIIAPNDMRDVQVNVVRVVTKVVSGAGVRPCDDKVIELLVVEDNPTLDRVVYNRGSVPRRAKSDGVGLVFGQRRNHPLRRSTRPIVHGLAFLFLRLLAFGIQLLGRANTRVRFTRGQ